MRKYHWKDIILFVVGKKTPLCVCPGGRGNVLPTIRRSVASNPKDDIELEMAENKAEKDPNRENELWWRQRWKEAGKTKLTVG